MRQVTATEKYRAVNEGKMTQKAFVRDMRIAHPSLISQWNGYSDTVQILKNKGFISEKSGVDTYDSRYELNISTDSIDRGVRYELEALGHDPVTCDDKEAQQKSKERAIKNLKKDPLHYINLLAKDSSHVDKNDKPKEVKRGAADKDTFNDLKKATLKEGYSEEQINSAIQRIKEKKEAEKKELPKSFADQEKDQIEKDAMKAKGMIKETIDKAITAIQKQYPGIKGLNDQIVAFLKMHYQDILDGADPVAEFDNYVEANYDRLDETEPVVTERVGSLQEFISLIEDRAAESGFSPAEEAEEVIEALQDHYNLSEKKGKDHDGDGDIDGDDYMAAKETNFSPDEIKTVSFPNGLSVTVGEPHPEEEGVVNFIHKGQNGYEIGFLDGSEGGSYRVDFNGEFLDEDDYIEEKKGKDHDGDGDIDSDDYMAAKDKAIKKAMGKNVNEAIKAIITKVLEEGTINEAATNELARIAEDYAGFEGMKSAILDLQNIVSDIEGFYDKTREKIQKVYNSIGEIRNEEGLKVGGFVAPAIESAFNKDLRPVVKHGFTKGLETPKVKTLSQADIDAARAAGDIEEEPKQTMFTPVNENKK